jgi:hypothetical protein
VILDRLPIRLDVTKNGARLDKYKNPTFRKKSEDKGSEKSLMNNVVQDEIKNIVSQLQRLQLQETELLQRLEFLNETETNATQSPIATRLFVIGDEVRIKNPRPLQPKKGKIIRIGVDTDRITVLAKNGSKVVRASSNLIHID